MPVFISMLRGVNLGPHNRIKMDALRATYEAIGWKIRAPTCKAGMSSSGRRKRTPGSSQPRFRMRLRRASNSVLP